MTRSIAILSQRRDFVRFIESEVSRFGFVPLVKVNAADACGVCAFIVDAESGRALPTNQQVPVLAISSDFSFALSEQETGVYHLSWPSSVAELARFLNELQGNHGGTAAFEGRILTEPMHSCERSFSFLQDERAVQIFQNKILLSEAEYKLLHTLYEAGGEAVARADLDRLLGSEGSNMTDVYICHLRGKLEKPFSVRLIHTVRGKGYYLDRSMFS